MSELKSVLVEEADDQTIEDLNRAELRALMAKADQRMMHALGPIRSAQTLLAGKGAQMGFTPMELETLTTALEFVFVRTSHIANRKVGKEIIEDILDKDLP